MAEKICGIYPLTIKTDYDRNYYYVGQSQNCKKRFRDHKCKLRNQNHPNKKVQAIFNSYNNISFEVLETCEIEDLCKYEQWWIDEMHGRKFCMNLAKDAEVFGRGLTMSREAKDKRKETWSKKSPEEIQEFKDKVREASTGRKHSSEARANMSIAAKKRGVLPETLEKFKAVGRALKGTKLSPEICKKMSESRKGEKNPNYGKKKSDEQKLKISITKTGKPNPHKGNVTKWSDARRKRFDEKKKQKLKDLNDKKSRTYYK